MMAALSRGSAFPRLLVLVREMILCEILVLVLESQCFIVLHVMPLHYFPIPTLNLNSTLVFNVIPPTGS
jgi:hypothetical protein